MVNGPSHVKQLSLIHVCKIELKMFFLHVWKVWSTEYERLVILKDFLVLVLQLTFRRAAF